MLFTKPKDLRYVDLCIWLDENMYKEDVDDNIVFEYLWHLVYMLARKGKIFSRNYYEDFATFMATSLYLRIKNPKQFCDPPKMKKITSILNYIKKTIYPRKVDFEQQFYAQTMVSTNNINVDNPYRFSDLISESIDEICKIEFNVCLMDIAKTWRYFLKKIPYYGERDVWYNIYVSCLLTFLNLIILDHKTINKIQSVQSKSKIEQIYNNWKTQKKDYVILFHLDSKMKDYIKVLTTELQHIISNDLCYISNSYIPSDDNMTYLALSNINSLEVDSEQRN